MPDDLVSGKGILHCRDLKYLQVESLIIGNKLNLRYPKQILSIP